MHVIYYLVYNLTDHLHSELFFVNDDKEGSSQQKIFILFFLVVGWSINMFFDFLNFKCFSLKSTGLMINH